MNVFEGLYKKIDSLRDDLINGSTSIALKALDIVTAAIDLNTKEDESFPAKITQQIIKCKPAMAAVEIVCNYALQDYRINRTKVKKYFSNDVRDKIFQSGEQTISKAYNRLFTSSDKIFTIASCSFSTNILKLLRLADKRGKRIQLLIIKSVWDKKDYSSILAYELSNTGILSKIINLVEFANLRDKVDFCVIGADGYDYSNNVVNGVPSKSFAELVQGHTPLYVVAESFKKINTLKISDGFEYIESDFITEIITDDGIWHLDIDNESKVTENTGADIVS